MNSVHAGPLGDMTDVGSPPQRVLLLRTGGEVRCFRAWAMG